MSQVPPTPSSVPSLIDALLQHYSKFFASAANQDKGLKVLQWTLWLLAYRGSNSTTAPALRKLYGEVSFARYLLRFYGLPDALLALRTGSWTVGTSKFAKFLGSLMALSMVAFYPLEHVAYVKWMLPTNTQQNTIVGESSKRSWYTAERLSAYSCRLWFAYLVAEMTQSTLSLWELYQEQKKKKKDPSSSATNAAMVSQQLQLTRSLLFTLPCINWSLPNWDTQPWLAEGTCNGLMWIEAVLSMIQAVRAYRMQQ